MGLTAARPFVVSAMVTLMLLSRPGHAAEGDGSIADGGAFFSPEALSEANDIVNTIRTLHDRDVRVETYRDVPSHLKDDLARDGLEKFYDDWLNRRARQLGVQGVFVLVTRSPGRVQVGVDRSTQRKAFTRGRSRRPPRQPGRGFPGRPLRRGAAQWTVLREAAAGPEHLARAQPHRPRRRCPELTRARGRV